MVVYFFISEKAYFSEFRDMIFIQIWGVFPLQIKQKTGNPGTNSALKNGYPEKYCALKTGQSEKFWALKIGYRKDSVH